MSKRILFIDDEPYFMDAHIESLRDEGYRVDGAEDGDQALERLQTSKYDLVILDIIMPPGNVPDTKNGMRTGVRIYEHLRQAIDRTVPILFLTVVENRDFHQHITQTEHEHGRPRPPILVKPVLPSELVEQVQKLID